MTVTAEKIQELTAVVSFWKYRVEETRRHLDRLLARQASQPQTYMEPLIEMKTRELADSQRGLRKAQAALGRLHEMADPGAVFATDDRNASPLEQAASDADALPVPEPEPAPPRDRRPVPTPMSKFPMSEFKVGALHRPSV